MVNLMLLSLMANASTAQAPATRRARSSSDSPEPIVTRQPLFSIPFFINPKAPQRPDKVHLFVSGDQGKNWSRYQTRSILQNRFDFQAGQDGEFWFIVRTHEDPARIDDRARPEKIVIVDRQPPELTLELKTGPADQVVATWEVQDPRLRSDSFKLEYRADPNGSWKPLEVRPRNADDSGSRYVGEHTWSVEVSTDQIEVRAEVYDRAGNSKDERRQLRLGQSRLDRVAANQQGLPDAPLTSTLDRRENFATGESGELEARELEAELPPLGSERSVAGYDSPLDEEPLGLAPSPRANAEQADEAALDRASDNHLPQIAGRPKMTPRRQRLPWQRADESQLASDGSAQDTASPVTDRIQSNRPTSDSGWLGLRRDAGPPPPQLEPNRGAPLSPPPADAASEIAIDSRLSSSAASTDETFLSEPSDLDPGPRFTTSRRRSDRPESQAEPPSGHTGYGDLEPQPPSPTAADYQPLVAGVNRPLPLGNTDVESIEDALDPGPMGTSTSETPAPRPAPIQQPSMPSPSTPPMTSSRVFDLDYDVTDLGNSPVARVELWYTEDDGQTWRAHGIDPDRKSPYRVEFDREGMYGFRLLVHNEVGVAARPPQPGDTPDLVVGIDWTKPKTHIDRAIFTKDAADEIDIRWHAEDAYLAERPISLAFAPAPHGPWYPVAEDLPNTGHYVWSPEHPLPRKVYLRLSATDRAGNVGQDKMVDPVDFGQLAPRGIIRQFRPRP